MSLVAYCQMDKEKSRRVCEAFAQGCGGSVTSVTEPTLRPGGAAFYGVRPPWLHLWEQARHEGRDAYYIDNAFVDAGREHYFRIGKNAFQSWSREPSDGKRLAALGVQIQPWKRDGRHILICPQSVEFMAMHGNGDWLSQTVGQVQAHTDRPVILRAKGSTRSLAADFKDAWLIVAHSSAVATEALLAGLPVVVTDPLCAAAEFGSTFAEIETPKYPDGRGEWAARLADSQWSIPELKKGIAWTAVQGW